MERLWTFISGKNKEPQQKEVSDSLNNSERTPDAHDTVYKEQMTNSLAPVPVKPDPKVVEFFEDFPEPYRQKAIDRFSKRQGLYKWDIFWETAMHEEMRQAKKGIFLEDQREYAEMMFQHERLEREEQMETLRKNHADREIPAWEREVLKVIPLQPEESMKLKLFQVFSVSGLGLTFLWQWSRFQKSKPSKYKLGSTMLGTIGLFGVCQIVAVARLMDLGPFDRTVDKRDFVTKSIEQMKSDYNLVMKYLEERSKKP